MKKYLTFICMVATVFLIGCSSSPSVSDLKKTMGQQIDSESGGKIKLVSFKKTDGQKQEVLGVQTYSLSWEAEIEFQTDGTWFNNEGTSFSFSTTPPPNAGSWAAFQSEFVDKGINVHHGQRVKIAGVTQAEKSEKGWTFDGGSFQVISGT